MLNENKIEEIASTKEDTIIENLNANNYWNWQFKIEMLLIKEDLFDVITDSPPDTAKNDWVEKNKNVQALIIVHVKHLNNSGQT